MTASRRPALPPQETAGPAETAARKPLRDQSSADLATVTPLPLRWAQSLIEGATGHIPRYGSSEWLALPDNDRRKVAATCIAAEAWRFGSFSEPSTSIAELPSRRARRIAEARRPRPGDYLGGPLDWASDV